MRFSSASIAAEPAWSTPSRHTTESLSIHSARAATSASEAATGSSAVTAVEAVPVSAGADRAEARLGVGADLLPALDGAKIATAATRETRPAAPPIQTGRRPEANDVLARSPRRASAAAGRPGSTLRCLVCNWCAPRRAAFVAPTARNGRRSTTSPSASRRLSGTAAGGPRHSSRCASPRTGSSSRSGRAGASPKIRSASSPVKRSASSKRSVSSSQPSNPECAGRPAVCRIRASTPRTRATRSSRSRATLGSSANWAGLRLRPSGGFGNAPMRSARPNPASTGAPTWSSRIDDSRTAPWATPTRCSSPTASTTGTRAVTASPASITVLPARRRPRLAEPSRGTMRHGRPSAAIARSLSSST
jgi:hypothetical protein